MICLGLIDCEDSYTLNLADYLRQCGTLVEVISHDRTSWNTLDQKDGIILSPGPKKPSDLPILSQIISHYEASKPILGICLGHQAIGDYYGYQVGQSSNPVHGLSVDIFHDSDIIFQSMSMPFLAMRYNSLTVNQSDNDELQIICWDHANEVMGFKHKKHNIYSFQFHPESIGSPEGLLLLKNWVKMIKGKE